MGQRRSLTHFPESRLWSEAKRNNPLGSGDCAALPSGKKFTEADSMCRLVSPWPLEPRVPSARSLLPARPDFGAPLGPSTGASTQLVSGSGVVRGDEKRGAARSRRLQGSWASALLLARGVPGS